MYVDDSDDELFQLCHIHPLNYKGPTSFKNYIEKNSYQDKMMYPIYEKIKENSLT